MSSDRTFTFTVQAAPVVDLPAPGAAMRIAAADAHQAVRPAGWTSASNWNYSTFGSYGSGLHNPHYSTHGAYVLAMSGGHGHPCFFGALVFDYTARAWAYLSAVGATEYPSGPVYVASTNGSPWYEMSARAELPAPPHPYRNQEVVPPSLGGSARGDMIYVGRAAVCNEVVTGSNAHRFNMVTQTWSRAAASVGRVQEESSVVFDGVNRYYILPQNIHIYTSLGYLDATDWTFKTVGSFSLPSSIVAGQYGTAFLYQRLVCWTKGGTIIALDLDNLSAGWRTLTVTNPYDGNHSAWTYHTAQGCFYLRGLNTTGQTIKKLTPPASNPLTNAWIVSDVTLTGDTVPEYPSYNVVTAPYRCLHYIPSLQMLGWVTANGVALLNPT